MASQNLDSAGLKAVDFNGLVREDVMNKIWDISKIPLPFTDLVGSGSAKNSYKEWTLDQLADPDITNAVIDGSNAKDGNDVVLGTRVGNHHQISDMVVRVSYRADASDTIGRAKELAYQLMRRQQELRRSVEAIALTNQASIADDGDTVAGKAGGLPAWLTTTHINGTPGGFSGGLVSARTPGIKQVLTETAVRDAVQGVYEEGGDPSVFMCTPDVIRKFSEYLFDASARVATLYSDQGKSAEKATALGSVNVFVTDFGTLKMIPNRLQQKHLDSTGPDLVSDVFILDPQYLQLCYFKGYRTDTLAKLGLAENRQMCVDWTLIVNTEKAHAIIGDIDGTANVTV